VRLRGDPAQRRRARGLRHHVRVPPHLAPHRRGQGTRALCLVSFSEEPNVRFRRVGSRVRSRSGPVNWDLRVGELGRS